MRVERSLAGLVLLVFLIHGGCDLIGGPEGTYTIDRERTRAGFERYAAQTITQLVGEDAAERKKMQEEAGAVLDQISLELHLEPGGKFHGKSELGEERESFEGTWTLRGDKLETTTVSKNGKQLSSPRIETVHYEDGRLSYQDAEVPFPFLILSKQ
ncbi:MAG TPA: hypothetical protein VKM72_19850 [Thermoanaerobaculia bacterium]|nr:hypothetical protein [Thermoanaerobaculia bacterium]